MQPIPHAFQRGLQLPFALEAALDRPFPQCEVIEFPLVLLRISQDALPRLQLPGTIGTPESLRLSFPQCEVIEFPLALLRVSQDALPRLQLRQLAVLLLIPELCQ